MTVRLPLQWDSSQGGQTGDQWAELKGYSHGNSTQEERWTTALNLPELGQKAARQKNTAIKERATHSFSGLQNGVLDVGNDDEEREPVEPITSPCDSISANWGLSDKKPVYVGYPVPLCAEEGLGYHPTPVMWYRNGHLTQHSWKVIRLTQSTTINFIFYSEVAVHNILQYYFGTGDDNKWPGLIPAIQTVHTVLQTGPCYRTVCVTVRGLTFLYWRCMVKRMKWEKQLKQYWSFITYTQLCIQEGGFDNLQYISMTWRSVQRICTPVL